MSSLDDRSAQIHHDAVADTHEAYIAFHGWVLKCAWCDHETRGRTKDDAVALMQEHYAPFDVEVWS